MNSNIKIAKNTLLLYLRMLIVTIVSLYTSRVVLTVLGIEDFGIFSVIAGIIAFFTVINTSLTGSVQRFFNVCIANKDSIALKKSFYSALNIHFGIGLVILLLGETVGLYFFYKQLNIPEGRFYASCWVYHFSLISAVLQIIKTPYNALIVAYERMNFFAWVAVVEVLLKLGIVYLLLCVSWDGLIVYSILYFAVSLLLLSVFMCYCDKKLNINGFVYVPLNEPISIQMTKFSMWSFGGNISNVCSNHGLNILLNIFYSVMVNSAMGVTNQVTNTIASFMGNFQLAYKPSLVQKCVKGNIEDFQYFICKIAKYSYLLLFVLVLPLCLNIDFVLNLWLGVVPEYTADFVKILMIYLLIDSLSLPFYHAIEAKGDIKEYQIILSIINIITIPIAYVLLVNGSSPNIVVLIRVILNFFIMCLRFIYVKKENGFSIFVIVRSVALPIIFISSVVTWGVVFISDGLDGWNRLFVTALSTFFSLSLMVFFGIMTKDERKMIKSYIKKHL